VRAAGDRESVFERQIEAMKFERDHGFLSGWFSIVASDSPRLLRCGTLAAGHRWFEQALGQADFVEHL
jgi:hypothetical protein